LNASKTTTTGYERCIISVSGILFHRLVLLFIKKKKKTVMRTEEITYYQNMYEKIYTQKKWSQKSYAIKKLKFEIEIESFSSHWSFTQLVRVVASLSSLDPKFIQSSFSHLLIIRIDYIIFQRWNMDQSFSNSNFFFYLIILSFKLFNKIDLLKVSNPFFLINDLAD
jgi:hypothetical protein